MSAESEQARESFASILGWTVLVMGAFLATGRIAAYVCERLGVSPSARIVATGLLAGAVGVAAVLFVARWRGEGWRQVGLRAASPRALVVGLASSLPLGLGYALIFGWLGASPALVPNVAWVIVKFFVAQGIAEEVIFRGFVFDRLRRGRSFRRAATLSAVVFAVVHLANFLNGFTLATLIGVVASTVFAFILAYPAALLYERAGRTIWPFALTHTLIDSINWFPEVAAPGPSLLVYLGAVAVTAAWTLFLSKRWLPESTVTSRP